MPKIASIYCDTQYTDEGDPAGDVNWTNYSDIADEDGDCAAAADIPADGGITYNLIGSQFLVGSDDFAVPAGAKLHGIEFAVKRYASVADSVSDYYVALSDSVNHHDGDNLAKPDYWPTGLAYTYYGGPNTLCGHVWDNADLKELAIWFRAQNTHAALTRTAYVDHMMMTASYSRMGGPYRRSHGGPRSARERHAP